MEYQLNTLPASHQLNKRLLGLLSQLRSTAVVQATMLVARLVPVF